MSLARLGKLRLRATLLFRNQLLNPAHQPATLNALLRNTELRTLPDEAFPVLQSELGARGMTLAEIVAVFERYVCGFWLFGREVVPVVAVGAEFGEDALVEDFAVQEEGFS